MTEQKIQSKIIKDLEKNHNAYVVNGIYTKAGIPDLVACIPFTKEQVLKHFETHSTLGVFVGIEVKKPETKTDTSPLQEYNLGKIQSLGGLSLVAWSTNIVKDFLKGKQC